MVTQSVWRRRGAIPHAQLEQLKTAMRAHDPRVSANSGLGLTVLERWLDPEASRRYWSLKWMALHLKAFNARWSR